MTIYKQLFQPINTLNVWFATTTVSDATTFELPNDVYARYLIFSNKPTYICFYAFAGVNLT